MNIRHERPMPDMAFRMQAPLGITLRDGRKASVLDWSLTGLTSHDLPLTDQVDCVLSIPFQGVVLSFPITLEREPDTVHYRFRNLTGRQREVLGLFYRSLLSGRMATTGDMITSLDTPVDLIPMEETDHEREIAVSTKSPRGLRTLFVLSIYVVMCLTVFGYLGALVLTRLNEITVQHARFIAPMQQVSSQTAGFVENIAVPPGGYVGAGDEILRLSDPQAEHRLDDLRLDLETAKFELHEADVELAAHEVNRPAARRDLERSLALAIRDRRPEDFLGDYNLQDVTTAQRRLSAFDAGVSFAADDFNAIRLQLDATHDDRRQKMRALQADYDSFAESLNALSVIAPRDGRVSSLLVAEGQYLRAGTPLLDFEEDRPRGVVGWLDHRYSGHVYAGMPATVTFNMTGEQRKIDARVTQVEAAVDPARPNTYGIRVELEAMGITDDETRSLFTSNAPAKVTLNRTLFGWF